MKTAVEQFIEILNDIKEDDPLYDMEIPTCIKEMVEKRKQELKEP